MISLTRRQWLLVLGIAMVAIWVAMGVIERQITDDGGPGILAFEFVGSKHHASEMLAEWSSHSRDLVRLSLWIDYGFMLAYGAFFTLAGLATRDFAREHGLEALASAGQWAPWCATGAALFDALENANLLLVLGGHGGSVSPPLATACASVKFLLIVTAIVYVVWGLVARFRAHA
jgi:hypothetical protein